jgi:Ankyrin repeats (many copies)
MCEPDSDAALFTAAESGNLAEVKRLVGDLANVNAKNDCGEIPIFSAARGGHFPVVEYLDLSRIEGEGC